MRSPAPGGLLDVGALPGVRGVSQMGAGRNSWDSNDYDWDPASLEVAARPRRAATRPREGEAPEQEQQRVQRRQPFIGCQVCLA